MSQTIAHRHETHVHVPLTPIIALVVAAIIAAGILIVINQPQFTTSRTETSVGAVTAVLPASVPKPESPAVRRHLVQQAQASVSSPAAWRITHNHAKGISLDAFGGYVPAPPAPKTGVTVQHRAGQFPGKAR